MERIGNPEPAKWDRPASEQAPHERRCTNPIRTSTCVLNMNSKPRCGAAALSAAASSLNPDGMRCGVPAAPLGSGTHNARLRLSSPSRASAPLACPAFLCATAQEEGLQAASASLPSSSHRHHARGDQVRGGRAGCPNAMQPEPLTISPFFIRPRTRNWQAACGIWLNHQSFALPARVFRGHLGSA
jgi:hypothetical protein